MNNPDGRKMPDNPRRQWLLNELADMGCRVWILADAPTAALVEIRRSLRRKLLTILARHGFRVEVLRPGVPSRILEAIARSLVRHRRRQQRHQQDRQRRGQPLRFDEGFTGQRWDSLGRRRCYVRGEQVPCQPGTPPPGSVTPGRGPLGQRHGPPMPGRAKQSTSGGGRRRSHAPPLPPTDYPEPPPRGPARQLYEMLREDHEGRALVDRLHALGQDLEDIRDHVTWVGSKLDELMARYPAGRSRPEDEGTLLRLVGEREAAQRNLEQTEEANRRQAHALLRVPRAARVQWRVVQRNPPDQQALSPRQQEAVREAQRFLTAVLARGGRQPPPVLHVEGIPLRRLQRSYHGALPGGQSVAFLARRCTAGSAVHEWGHAVERQSPGVRQAARAFLQYRVAGERPVRLRDEFLGSGYDETEMGRLDVFHRFWNGPELSSAYYTGKEYPFGETEIIAMGLQALSSDPTGFARRDPQFCQFILGILHGRLRME